MGIFLIILIVIFLLWPVISRWLRGFMARRMEDVARRMMGMPSRGEEQRARKKARQSGSKSAKSSKTRRHRAPRQHASDLMQSVAVDATYTEVKEYSDDTTIHPDGSRTEQRTYREEQVSDVEFKEIKE